MKPERRGAFRALPHPGVDISVTLDYRISPCLRIAPRRRQRPGVSCVRAMRKRDYRAEDRARGSRHERGYDNRWAKIAEQVKREEPLCRPCHKRGIARATTQVDHIVPKAKGGSDDRANLQGICDDCHKAKTAREQGALLRTGCDASGMPTDPDHPWNRR